MSSSNAYFLCERKSFKRAVCIEKKETMKQTKGDFFVFSCSFLLDGETIKKMTRVLKDHKHPTDAFCMLN